MGIHEGMRVWRKGAEDTITRAETGQEEISFLVTKYHTQAKNFVEQNPNDATAFKRQFVEFILRARNREEAAKTVVRDEPHFIPDTIEGINHQAAFLIALATELNKAEYNQ